MFAIEKNVPMSSTIGRPPKYPLRKMEPGDSFFVERGDRKSISVSVSRLSKETGWIFRCRQVDGGVRVWRIK